VKGCASRPDYYHQQNKENSNTYDMNAKTPITSSNKQQAPNTHDFCFVTFNCQLAAFSPLKIDYFGLLAF